MKIVWTVFSLQSTGKKPFQLKTRPLHCCLKGSNAKCIQKILNKVLSRDKKRQQKKNKRWILINEKCCIVWL